MGDLELRPVPLNPLTLSGSHLPTGSRRQQGQLYLGLAVSVEEPVLLLEGVVELGVTESG